MKKLAVFSVFILGLTFLSFGPNPPHNEVVQSKVRIGGTMNEPIYYVWDGKETQTVNSIQSVMDIMNARGFRLVSAYSIAHHNGMNNYTNSQETFIFESK